MKKPSFQLYMRSPADHGPRLFNFPHQQPAFLKTTVITTNTLLTWYLTKSRMTESRTTKSEWNELDNTDAQMMKDWTSKRSNEQSYNLASFSFNMRGLLHNSVSSGCCFSCIAPSPSPGASPFLCHGDLSMTLCNKNVKLYLYVSPSHFCARLTDTHALEQH